MVHGDCSSRGCYAMTDDQIGEIYALARESFFGGQRAFQVQAYPFRMTAANFAQASQQSEHAVLADAEGRQRPLRGDAPGAEGRGVREALRVQSAGAAECRRRSNGIKLGTPWGGFRDPQAQQASLKFNPAGKCPVYEMPADVLAEVKAKQRQDDAQIASLSTRVTPAPIKTGRDGGMHPMFLAKLKPQEVREADGTVRYMVDENAAKQLGSYVNPPIETYPTEPDATGTAANAPRAARDAESRRPGATYMMAAAESKPAPAPARASSESGGVLSGLFASAGQAGSAATDDRSRYRRRPRKSRRAHQRRSPPRARIPRRRSPPSRSPRPPLSRGRTRADRAGRTRANARPPIGRERLKPDERCRADRSGRQLRPALGRDPVTREAWPELDQAVLPRTLRPSPCAWPARMRLPEPAVAVLVLLARAAGARLVAADLAPGRRIVRIDARARCRCRCRRSAGASGASASDISSSPVAGSILCASM